MMDKRALTRRYLAVLNDELGWEAVEGDDGEVKFSSPIGGFVWIANHAPIDPEYLRMFTGFRLAGFLEQIGSPLDLSLTADQLRLAMGAARVTHRAKCAKITALPSQDALEFSVEVVAAGPERMPSIDHLAAILPRMLRMLLSATNSFHEEILLTGLDPGEAAASPSDVIEFDNPF